MAAPTSARRLDTEPLTLPSEPLVSIVIPTYNEERYIVALLDSLAAQDYPPARIEVLVADGRSTDATRALVEAYASPFARLELVDNPRKITTAGLNEGMDAARGDCWIILGAHSIVRPDFVRQSVEALRRTGAACVGGPIETIGEGETGRAIAAAMSSPFGVGNARFRYANDEGDVDTVPFGCYHRRVWEVVGRFDESIEDVDDDSYNARLREAGGRIVLVPAIRSAYYPRQTYEALARQYWEYGRAKGTLLALGRRLEPRHFAPAAAVGGGTLLFLLGRRSAGARKALAMLTGGYTTLLLLASRRAGAHHQAHPARVALAIATMHATYGAGFILGALRGWLAERRPS